MFPDAQGSFYEEVIATAGKLEAVGMHEAARDLKNAFPGSTGGEVFGELGATLKQLASNPQLPANLLPEVRSEISQIDAAYDRIGQPRPFAMKVETR